MLTMDANRANPWCAPRRTDFYCAVANQIAALRHVGGEEICDAEIRRLIGLLSAAVGDWSPAADVSVGIATIAGGDAAPVRTTDVERLYAAIDYQTAVRCRIPGSDLVSALIQVDIDGDELTTDDLRTVVAAVLLAGTFGLVSVNPAGI